MLSSFKPRYDRGLWPVLIGVLLLPLGRAGFLLAAGEFQGAFAMLVVTGLALLALWSALPRAFEVWPDRVRIVLGWRWGMSIPLDTIAEVQPAGGVATFVHWGARFATSFKTAVRIRRTTGMTIVLSPDNPAQLIESVSRALENAR